MPPQSEGNSIAPPNPLPENISSKCGDAADSSILSAAADVPQKPEKKPTRQWAAWTRQEEESFFSALRQVGKNFEKITCRVQSKNKEQVRHYYYRLVRRMNKLLGPGFCLDAKNSKDTNAAMLRWWSLLEKYSCTASKLHLKPRRFKTFIETLAQQLLKDRNRTRRKRPYNGENGSIPITSESIYNKPPGHDVHLVKLVFVDSQSSQKLGNGKLTSTKRGVSVGKGEGAVMKNTNQRRRAACGAAYKKWEKAAIAGVSLVADAAEHLERTSIDNNGSFERVTSEILPPKSSAKNTASSSDCDLPLEHSATEGPQLNQTVSETNAQLPMKLKLQLFPIDEATRKALEKEDRNPHLELTLSARKRISSILEHLNRKWGDSSIASGEIMLFPYNAQSDTMAHLPKWTLKDSCASAGDVHTAVGSPTVFRLRYGWFSSLEDQSLVAEIPSDNQTKDQSIPGQLVSNPQSMVTDNERETRDERECQVKRGDDVAWADSLTNISVGDLLSEANCHNGSTWTGIPLSSDSFDAAIAGFLSRNQAPPPLASIFDAEETCDEFSFHRVSHKDQDTVESVDHELTSDNKTNPAKANELLDFYWPDSLGPLDIDVPAARYQGQDLIFADSCSSLGGLTRSIAGGLEAFQNCSLFAPEKEPLAVDQQP